MKLVTYTLPGVEAREQAGVLHGNLVLDVERLIAWARRQGVDLPLSRHAQPPSSVLALLRQGPEGMAAARAALDAAGRARTADLIAEPDLARRLSDVRLRTPVTEPPTIRDFYAFEQHVRAARAGRNSQIPAEWYQFPVFYFSNTAALFGAEEPVPFPRASRELDFELEMAAVIGREGRDIPAEEAPAYIAGYMVMNDWSARDLQRQEMKLSLGPAKGKDFATSLGPWLVTPDELEDRRVGSGQEERYDLVMSARINGDQVSNANFRDIYFTFPQMIEHASRHVHLRAGDILGSGTCGTGCIFELGTERHRWLEPGDVVELEIERLGLLRNTIAPPTKAP